MPPYRDYQPNGASRELFHRQDSEIIVSGPSGTGKSRGVIEKLHLCCEKHEGCRILAVRKTRASLTNTGVVTYEEIVLPKNSGVIFSTTDQEYRYPNTSILGLGGLDKTSKIMSSEYDIIYVQEVTEATEPDWENLTTRLRWGRIPYQQIIGDCNPGPPHHWLKRRCQAGKTVMLESRHEDNPALWDGKGWTPKGAAYLAKLDALTGVRYLRLRKGIWAAAEGMVYDQYDPAIHLIDRFDVPRTWPRIWCVDFGYTNPFVWQTWAADPDGRLYRYREIYKTQTLVQDHAGAILRAAQGEPLPIAIICDHDAEDRATLERYLGLPTAPAFKSISPGIQAVQRRLRFAGDKRARLFFLRDSLIEIDEALSDAHKPTCTEQEIEGYIWPQEGSGKHGEAPVKRDDHGMDAMRYLVAFADGVAYDPTDHPRAVEYQEDYQISRI